MSEPVHFFDLYVHVADGRMLVEGVVHHRYGIPGSYVGPVDRSLLGSLLERLIAAKDEAIGGPGSDYSFRDLGFSSEAKMWTYAKRAQYLSRTNRGCPIVQAGMRSFAVDVEWLLEEGSSCEVIAARMWDAIDASDLPGTSVVPAVPKGTTDRATNLASGSVWFVARCDDAKKVAKAFGLVESERVAWAHGCGQGAVFVSPSLDGFVLVDVSQQAYDLDNDGYVAEATRNVSKKLKTDVFFFAEPGSELASSDAVWARNGKLVRHVWSPGDGEGAPTDVEVEMEAEGWNARATVDGSVFPDGFVRRLARGWCLDPDALDRFVNIPAGVMAWDYNPPWRNGE
jgi:hypothetical protein